MKRVTVYRSWTVLIELTDIQAMAGTKDMEALISDIGSVLVKTFDRSMVGYTWDWQDERLLVTLKTREQATILADTWDAIVEEVTPEK